MFLSFKPKNRFTARNSNRYSERQKELHDNIKNLHKTGISYRRITKHLNVKGIKTHTRKEWVKLETLLIQSSRSVI